MWCSYCVCSASSTVEWQEDIVKECAALIKKPSADPSTAFYMYLTNEVFPRLTSKSTSVVVRMIPAPAICATFWLTTFVERRLVAFATSLQMLQPLRSVQFSLSCSFYQVAAEIFSWVSLFQFSYKTSSSRVFGQSIDLISVLFSAVFLSEKIRRASAPVFQLLLCFRSDSALASASSFILLISASLPDEALIRIFVLTRLLHLQADTQYTVSINIKSYSTCGTPSEVPGMPIQVWKVDL